MAENQKTAVDTRSLKTGSSSDTDSRLTVLETQASGFATSITNLENRVSALESSVSGIANKIDNLISNLEEAVAKVQISSSEGTATDSVSAPWNRKLSLLVEQDLDDHEGLLSFSHNVMPDNSWAVETTALSDTWYNRLIRFFSSNGVYATLVDNAVSSLQSTLRILTDDLSTYNQAVTQADSLDTKLTMINASVATLDTRLNAMSDLLTKNTDLFATAVTKFNNALGDETIQYNKVEQYYQNTTDAINDLITLVQSNISVLTTAASSSTDSIAKATKIIGDVTTLSETLTTRMSEIKKALRATTVAQSDIDDVTQMVKDMITQEQTFITSLGSSVSGITKRKTIDSVSLGAIAANQTAQSVLLAVKKPTPPQEKCLV